MWFLILSTKFISEKIPIVNIDTGFSILSVILYYESTQRWARSSPNRDEVCGSRVDQNHQVLRPRNGQETPFGHGLFKTVKTYATKSATQKVVAQTVGNLVLIYGTLWLPKKRASEETLFLPRFWQARVGSNHRPPPCQGGALPLSYAPVIEILRHFYIERRVVDKLILEINYFGVVTTLSEA